MRADYGVDPVVFDRQRVEFLLGRDKTKARRALEIEFERVIASLAKQMQLAVEMQGGAGVTLLVDQPVDPISQHAIGIVQKFVQPRQSCDGDFTVDVLSRTRQLESIDRRRGRLIEVGWHQSRAQRRYTGSMARPLIVLASTSRYRRELLERLRLPFEVHAPAIDETPLAAEKPRDTALRLARAKALNVAPRFPGAVVIGSDQTVDLNATALGKPQSHQAAVEQLRSLQGRTAVFYSALAVAGPDNDQMQIDCVPTTATFRRLSDAQIEAYLRADQPYDCAGAARIESLGIALMERVESDDPTALIGLPLIRLTSMLDAAGIDVLAPQ